MPPQLADIRVSDRSSIGQVRREARRIGRESGLSEDATSRLGLVAVEAATNILRHGDSGSLIVNPAPPGLGPAAIVLAADSGPGIPDIDQAMTDGYSSSGGMGGGLGAIKRMSNWLDIYSRPGLGATVAAIIAEENADPAPLPRACGLLAPKPGETVCGDSWSVREAGGCTWALLCDGLGHGAKAAQAAEAAIHAFEIGPLNDLPQLMSALDRALAKERGAAALAVRINVAEGWAEAAGIGNVAGAIIASDGAVQRLVSQGGVVGAGARTPGAIRYDWTPGSTLIMTTDGLRTIHDFAAWPGLLHRGPLIIAGVIHRDMSRRSDDSGLLAVKGDGA